MTTTDKNAQMVLKKDERRIPVELCRIDRSELRLQAGGDAAAVMALLGLVAEKPAKLFFHVRHIGQCGLTGTFHASGSYIVASIDSHDGAFEKFVEELAALPSERQVSFLMDTLNPTIACAQTKPVTSRRMAA